MTDDQRPRVTNTAEVRLPKELFEDQDTVLPDDATVTAVPDAPVFEPRQFDRDGHELLPRRQVGTITGVRRDDSGGIIATMEIDSPEVERSILAGLSFYVEPDEGDEDVTRIHEARIVPPLVLKSTPAVQAVDAGSQDRPPVPGGSLTIGSDPGPPPTKRRYLTSWERDLLVDIGSGRVRWVRIAVPQRVQQLIDVNLAMLAPVGDTMSAALTDFGRQVLRCGWWEVTE